MISVTRWCSRPTVVIWMISSLKVPGRASREPVAEGHLADDEKRPARPGASSRRVHQITARRPADHRPRRHQRSTHRHNPAERHETCGPTRMAPRRRAGIGRDGNVAYCAIDKRDRRGRTAIRRQAAHTQPGDPYVNEHARGGNFHSRALTAGTPPRSEHPGHVQSDSG